MSNSGVIKSGDIEETLKEGIRQAIITLYNFDVVTGRYVNEELQKEKMIKEITAKWDGKYSEESIREAMDKAHQHYKQIHGYNNEQP
jgi:cytochrome c-type biogenesis protein CcmE